MLHGSVMKVREETPTRCHLNIWFHFSVPILPDRLQQVKIPILSNKACKKIFGGIITDGILCAGREKGICRVSLQHKALVTLLTLLFTHRCDLAAFWPPCATTLSTP